MRAVDEGIAMAAVARVRKLSETGIAGERVRRHEADGSAKLVEVMGGPAGARIVRQAVEWPADLIVCGTHGRGGIRRIVMGSDAEFIIRHTPVPVSVLRSLVPPATNAASISMKPGDMTPASIKPFLMPIAALARPL